MRWHRVISGLRELRGTLGLDPAGEQVRGFAILQGTEPSQELLDRLFLLVGMSTLDSPPARYQPAAIAELLEHCRALVLLHRDKHGLALGIYSSEPIRTEGRLEGLCDKVEALLVPFAIPPMLARWDRAIAELREHWMATREEDFPVPPAPEPSTWEQRRRRRNRRRDKDAPAEQEASAAADGEE